MKKPKPTKPPLEKSQRFEKLAKALDAVPKSEDSDKLNTKRIGKL